VILAFEISGISMVSPFSSRIFLGLTPMTRTSCPLLTFPEKIRANPRTADSSSLLLGKPR
jgi:hypothetical protein